MLKWVYDAHNIYLLIVTRVLCTQEEKGEQGLQHVLRNQHSLSEHIHPSVADLCGVGCRVDICGKAECSALAVRPSHTGGRRNGTCLHGQIYPGGDEVTGAHRGAEAQKEEIRGKN